MEDTVESSLRSHDYYEKKCIEHLNRVMASHHCALASAHDAAQFQELKKVYALAESADGGLTSLTNDVHFVALKTNFELFLALSLRQLWIDYFDDLAIESKESIGLSALTGFQSKHDLRLLVIDKITPRHGLTAIKDEIKRLTGIDIRSLLFGGEKLWPQIEVSFQLRHLIEHRNGRIDRGFTTCVRDLWPMTSFGRSEMPLPGQKVEVTVDDVSASYEAMKTATSIVSSGLRAWRPAGYE